MFNLFVMAVLAADPAPDFAAEFVFPLHDQHNHAPGIVECPDGELLVSWYRGTGERSADDVKVMGARKRPGAANWSAAEVWADTPEFPDCNTALMLDRDQQLWLFYPTVIANSWESCLTNYRVSKNYQQPGTPDWHRSGVLFLKPADFADEARRAFDQEIKLVEWALPDSLEQKAKLFRERLGDKLYQRLGWQPRCKPTILPDGRMLLPLYSDTFSMSMMAISDDHGRTWLAGKPMLGFGNIQPSVVCRESGTLVAYMRENGPRKRIRYAESTDRGETWGPVGQLEILNPGSGLDAVRLKNGHWILVCNDLLQGRNRLTVYSSDDEGKTWPKRRALEDQPEGKFHYPAVIQGADGLIHVVYSYFVEGGKTMKHAAFPERWILGK